jgi:hypothetical protein
MHVNEEDRISALLSEQNKLAEQLSSSSSTSATLVIYSYFFLAKKSFTLRAAVSSVC